MDYGSIGTGSNPVRNTISVMKQEREKEFTKLQNRYDEIRQTQRDLGYYELEEPIFRGYQAYLGLRDDIKNREDSHVFQEIIDKFGYIPYYRREIKDYTWNKPLRLQQSYRFVHDKKPHIKHIIEKDYLKLPPTHQKWFEYDSFESLKFKWNGKRYRCNVPNYFFVIKYRKYYMTKVKISDVLLEQELAEVESILRTKFWSEWCGGDHWRGGSKWFRRAGHKSMRRKTHQIIQSISDYDYYNFEPNKAWT